MTKTKKAAERELDKAKNELARNIQHWRESLGARQRDLYHKIDKLEQIIEAHRKLDKLWEAFQ